MKKMKRHMTSFFPLIFLIPMIWLSPHGVRADEVTWITGTGSINNASNWSSNPVLPGTGDDVIFANTSGPSLTSTADLTNSSASFGGTAGYDINLGASDTWTLTDSLDVSLASGKSWTFYSGTVTVRNASGTATATFGTKSPDTYGRLYMRGGTLNVDHLNIAGFDGTNSGLIFEEGTLNIYKGSQMSFASGGGGGAFNVGSVAGKTAIANFLGGSHTASGEAFYVGGSGKGLVTVDGSETTLGFTGVIFGIGRNSNSVDNKFTVSGGAEVTVNLTSGVVIGYENTSARNILEVTGSGSSFTLATGGVTLGKNGSTGNEIIVSNGGHFKLEQSSSPIYIGEQAASSGNKLTVTGAGSLLETATSGDNSYIGVGMHGSNNELIITNGGRVNAYRVILGVSSDSAKGNSVVVDKGGLLHIISSISAYQDATNTVLIEDGGILEFEKKTPSIGVSSGASVTLGDGGIISFAGVEDAPTTALSNLIYSGVQNGLRLDNSSNASVASYTFTSGTVGTYAGLELKNGGIWTSGTLVIGAGGELTGDGTINGETTVASGGRLAIGHSPGTMTFNDDLILSGGSESDFEITGLTSGLFDLAQGGVGSQTVAFGGTLNLLFSSGFNTTGSAKIFDFENYSGDFSSVVSTGLASGYSASFDALTGTVTVIPEPGICILLGMGLSFICFRVFRKHRRIA